MSEKDNISTDELFQRGLDGYEADFSPTDWDQMLELLEDDEMPVPVAPITGKKKRLFNRRITLSIMSILVTVTAAVLWIGSPTNTNDTTKSTIPQVSEIQKGKDKKSKDAELLSQAQEPVKNETGTAEEKQSEYTGSDYVESTTGSGSNASDVTQEGDDIGKDSEPATPATGNAANKPDGDDGTNKVMDASGAGEKLVEKLKEKAEEVFENKPAVKKLGNSDLKPDGDDGKFKLSLPDTAGFYKRVVSRRWVDTTWKYEYYKHSRDIEDGWIGMYFTQQNLTNPDDWSSIGRNEVNQGFNLQFMGGNLIPGENLAIFGGLDWGMQFFGRSKKHEVLLNTVNEDRGVTFLRSHTNDVMASAQIEWSQFPVVPYLTGSFGTRIFTTGQTTRSLIELEDYESSQSEGVHTRATLAAKYGAGARVKISPHVYFDARYEAVVTNPLKVVDYNNTGFDGLDYSLGFKELNINSQHFRFGFVFDISEERSKRVVDEPAHWEETVQEIYVDPQDSSKIFVPCPCSPCDKKKKRSSSSNNSRPSRDGGIFDDWDFSPGSGGSVPDIKKDFPGISKPRIPN